MNAEHKGIYCPKEGRFCSVELDELSTVRADSVFISHDNNIDVNFLNIIEEKLKEARLTPVSFRTHEVTSEFYCKKICKEIKDCAFMIADLSYWDSEGCEQIKDKIKSCTNPNVAMEIGLGYAFQKDVILLVCKEQIGKVPSNLQGVDFCIYNFPPSEDKQFLERLTSKIQTARDNFWIRKKVELFHDFKEFIKVITRFKKETKFRYYVRDSFDIITMPEPLLSKTPDLIELKREQVEIFKRSMKEGGIYKDLVNKHSIENHFLQNNFYTSEELKTHLANVICLLKTYSTYELAFTENEIPFAFEVVEKGAWIHKLGSRADFGKKNLKAVLFTVKGAVDGLKIEFEKMWAEENVIKQKATVIGWLQGLKIT